MKSVFNIIAITLFYSYLLHGQIIDVSNLYQSNKYFYPKIQNINQDFGFSELRINALEEDKDGFIWIGTIEGGLWKYDGYEFHSFIVEHDQENTLPSNNILDIHQDSKNILWILTDRGLCYYNPLEEKIINFELSGSNSITNRDYKMTCLAEDNSGHIFIGTNTNNIIRIAINASQNDIENQLLKNSSISELTAVTMISFEHELSDALILDMKFDSYGRLWLNNKNTAGFIDLKSFYQDSSLRAKSDSYKYFKKIESSHLRDIEIIESKIYFSSPDTLYTVIPEKVNITIQKLPIKENTLSNQQLTPRMDLQGSKKMWIGNTHINLSLFNEYTTTFYPLSFESKDVSNSIYERNITCFLKTKDNAIFIGTAWGGLFKFESHSVLASFHPDLQRFHLSKIQNLRFVFQDSKDLLWMIIDDIYIMDRHTGKTIAVIEDSMLDFSRTYKNKMWEDRNGRYWIAAEGVGLLYIEIEIVESGDKRSIKLIEHNNIIPFCYSTALYEDKMGNIWTGTVNYTSKGDWISTDLIKIHQESLAKEVYNITNQPATIATKEGSTINHILEDRSGNIWLATDFGLIKFNPANSQSDIYPIKYQHIADDLGFRVLTISEDPWNDNQLWIGTAGGGLFHFNKTSFSFQNISLTIETEVNYISSIIKDNANKLWLATEKGILKMSIEEESGKVQNTQYFNTSTGLITNDFRSFYGHNASITNDGEIIFTGDRGFQIIDPALVKMDSFRHNLFFEEFYINQEPVPFSSENSILPSPLNFSPKINLPHYTNSFGFKVTSPNFIHQDHIHYSFLLNNHNEHWVQNNGNRSIQYYNVRPGKYQLKVKMDDSEHSFSKIIDGPIIRILPPWWHSIYAYIIYFLLFIIIAWIIINNHWSRQKLKRNIEYNRLEAEKLKELDKLKSRFFSNVSHGLRTPLTLILSPLEELMKKHAFREDAMVLEMIQRNANRLMHSISDILELTKLDTHKIKLNLRKVNIVDYTNHIVSNFKSWTKQKDIELQLQAKIEDNIFNIDPDKYRIILSNLLSNAIKYSDKGGIITVNVIRCKDNCQAGCNEQGKCLKVSVKDTGCGIPKANLPYIFNRYHRVAREDRINDIGTGLGLSLVKELTNLLQGTVEVLSEEGKFTEFILRFPYDRSEYIPAEIFKDYDKNLKAHLPKKSNVRKDPILSIQEDKDKRIILIIEDDQDMRELISSMLRNKYRILEAEDGSRGLEKAISTIPDLIISDIMMPGKDGYELSKEIKQNELTNHIPIILLTAKAQMHEKIYGLETGADDYLTKPFYKIELLTRIENLISQREKLKQKYSKQNMLYLEQLPAESMDEVFLQKLQKVIEAHFSNEHFNVQLLQKEMGISRTQLHRKLRALTNKSASELIRTIRLEKAAKMIKNKTGSISEIAYLSGFSDPSYFSRAFKEYYGCSPSKYPS